MEPFNIKCERASQKRPQVKTQMRENTYNDKNETNLAHTIKGTLSKSDNFVGCFLIEVHVTHVGASCNSTWHCSKVIRTIAALQSRTLARAPTNYRALNGGRARTMYAIQPKTGN